MDQGGGFRKRDRLELHIPVRVKIRETDGSERDELTRIEDVTQFGASFLLDTYVEQGRIVYLAMPLPWRLRQFDQAAELYRVYALVRWVKSVGERYSVGVAFVGKTPPTSYLHDPSRRYGTTGFTEKRRETRIETAVAVQMDVVNGEGDVVASEYTVTTNISRHGATCYTTLDTHAGAFLRLNSADLGFTTTAVVRSRRTDKNGTPTLHLEFVGEPWPLDIGDVPADQDS